MTSSFKFGLIGLSVAVVGLGAYLVNHSLKDGKTVKRSSNETSVAARSETEQVPSGAAEPTLAQAEPAAAGTFTPTDNNVGHAASPAPLGVGSLRDDIERSWHPRPVETKEATSPSMIMPGAGEPGNAHTETRGAATPGVAAGSTTPYVPQPAPTAVAPSTPAPAGPDADRMGLGERTTAASSPGDGAGTTAATGTTAAKPSTAPEKMTIHVVQPGDTYSALAARYLGSSRYANLIEKANPKLNPKRLYVGIKLKIPAAPQLAPATTGGSSPTIAIPPKAATTDAQKSTKPAPPPVDPARAYTVKVGDTWTSLANQFLSDGEPWTVLYEYNKERFPANSRTLHPGMVLEMPPKAASAPQK